MEEGGGSDEPAEGKDRADEGMYALLFLFLSLFWVTRAVHVVHSDTKQTGAPGTLKTTTLSEVYDLQI